MPTILRWFTWICFGFGLLLPLSLIPAGGHYINGQQVTFEEFWHRGGGPIFFIAGILFSITGYGFVHSRNWSRYLFTALRVAILLSYPFFGTLDWQVLFCLVWVGFVIYYLFWLPSAREYFGE